MRRSCQSRYVDKMLEMIALAGDFVGGAVWHRIIQIVTNHKDLQVGAHTMRMRFRCHHAHTAAFFFFTAFWSSFLVRPCFAGPWHSPNVARYLCSSFTSGSCDEWSTHGSSNRAVALPKTPRKSSVHNPALNPTHPPTPTPHPSVSRRARGAWFRRTRRRDFSWRSNPRAPTRRPSASAGTSWESSGTSSRSRCAFVCVFKGYDCCPFLFRCCFLGLGSTVNTGVDSVHSSC